jgi:arginyl-tRNA synthetase
MFLLPNLQIKKILGLGIKHSRIYNEEYKFSLRFCDRSYECHYTSAIAHQLSSKIQKLPLEIAQIIYGEIPTNSKFAIALTLEGIFNFTLTDTYISECLHNIEISDLALNFIPQPQDFPQYTYTQYVYSRCCALLRLAELVELKPQSRLGEFLSVNLIAIAESLQPNSQLTSSQVIKQCQKLTVNFLEYSDRTAIMEVLNVQVIKITKKLIYTLASGYIDLPEYL